ncbi:CvpA family protein [Neomegalonema perideroedes]|uniref:CvpA family protein n=1 Tax=Neomegalonema perideroedes TaxID=217219 RepID=UPI0003771CB0|nr:CvpA family protein [Neomegalonema perideroedes]
MDISPNVIDGVVIGVIFVSAILAWSRGFTRETLGLVGWALAAAGAAAAAPLLMPYMTKLPVVGGMLTGNCTFTLAAAFLIAFAVLLAILGILTPSLGDAVRSSAIGGLDKALGFLFGAARGVLLVAVAAWALHALGLSDSLALQEARTGGFLNDLRNGLAEALPTEAPAWASGRLDGLLSTCAPTSAPTAGTATEQL